jgi:hypothetical protein
MRNTNDTIGPPRPCDATKKKGNHGFQGWALINACTSLIRVDPWNPWLNTSPNLREKTRILALVIRINRRNYSCKFVPDSFRFVFFFIRRRWRAIALIELGLELRIWYFELGI